MASATALPLDGAISGAEAMISREGRPNVLLITVDDLNDWVGCLGGHPDVKTPNIDRLAQRGVLFTNAHCSAPACNPSRVSFLTGLRPSTTGIYDNDQLFRRSLPDVVTMPQDFMANGYRVVGGGKVFHRTDAVSWHEYFPSMTETIPDDPEPPEPIHASIPDVGRFFVWEALDMPEAEMGDQRVARWAERELKKEYDRPFFLAVGIHRPHMPWHVPKKYFDMYPPDKVTLPWADRRDLADLPPLARRFAVRTRIFDHVVDHDQWRNAVSAYLASITFADAQVGQVLDALDQSPHARETIVVLWGDNGLHLGEKWHWGKSTLWEESTRCALIFDVPGITKAGRICRRAAGMLDVYPTLSELCGLPLRKDLEGVSMLSLLKDPLASWDRPALTTHLRGNHALRSERWRYIRYNDGTEELYDHDQDPMELRNLSGDSQYTQIKADLARWLPKADAPPALGASPEKGNNEAIAYLRELLE